MAHIDHLQKLYPLKDRHVVDVGAGDGVYSRQIGECGAIVTAVEINAAKVSIAQAKQGPNVSFMLGAAQDLPLAANTQDLACFFFSLHHVPIDVQLKAIDEAVRVLKPGGRLHVVEPFAHGSMFDVVKLVEDETFVRNQAHKRLADLGEDDRFRLLDREDYVLEREIPTFDHFLDRVVRSDPSRLAVFQGNADAVEHAYNNAVGGKNGARVLYQPCAAYHFAVSS